MLAPLYCFQNVRQAGLRVWVVGRGFFVLVGHGLGSLEVRIEGVRSDAMGV